MLLKLLQIRNRRQTAHYLKTSTIKTIHQSLRQNYFALTLKYT